MADIKISALPAALSLTDADVLPVVNSATTKKATTAQLVAGGLSGGTANGLVYLNGSKTPTSSSAITYDGSSVVIAPNSASDALRITQTGAGNALVVEDSANPDSTPFVIDTYGSIGQGVSTPSSFVAASGFIQKSTLAYNPTFMQINSANDNSGSYVTQRKDRAGVIVNNNDALGSFNFQGHDGTSYLNSAYISTYVDGTPGTNSMPGRLVFSTTASGASSPTERMRIDSNGNVGIGVVTSFANNKLSVAGTGTDASSWFLRSSADVNPYEFRFLKNRNTNIYASSIVNQSDTLGAITFAGNDGTNYVLASSITSTVDGTPGTNSMPGRLVFATTASGAATPTERIRIDSAGNVGIGGAATVGYAFEAKKNVTGAINAGNIIVSGAIQSDVTTTGKGFATYLQTAATTFTLGNLNHFEAQQGVIGAGSTVTSQIGFLASSNLTGATNNYGFYSNIAAATGRWNFYANGTAANYFAGDMQLGKTVTAAGTTGAQTINKTIGSVNFAAAATSLVVTNNLVTTSSIIIATVASNDSTMKSVSVVAGSGSFTIYANAAATAETRVNFQVFN